MNRHAAPRIVARMGLSVLLLTTVVAGTGSAFAAEDPLPPPTNVRVTKVDHTSVTVAWEPPPGATHYRVTSSPNWFSRIVEDTSLTWDILFTDHEHSVSVRAYNDQGEISAATEITFTSPPAPPPVVPPTPQGVQVSTAPGSITVTWEPSFLDGVEADAYVVRLGSSGSPIVTTDTSLTHEVLPGGEFDVTVSARRGTSGFLDSDPSEPIEVTVPPAEGWEPLTAPSNLQLVIEDGIVTFITWDASEGGADPVTYRLNYHFGDQGPEHSAVIVSSTPNPFIDVGSTIGRLFECSPDAHPSGSWVIWVTAHSHGTTSPPSEQATVCI